MASDRARVSHDPTRNWRGLIAQQGRVTVEADWNEAATIEEEHDRALTLDFVGPVGTPDGGYAVTPVPATGGPPGSLPGDLTIGSGTLYVGGARLVLDGSVTYSAQPEWLDRSTDLLWVPPGVPPVAPATQELVYVLACEQEVSAVEDPALADVALGGPDTMLRRRILQRFVRQTWTGTAEDWFDTLKTSAPTPVFTGVTYTRSMRLQSTTSLQVSFPTAPDPSLGPNQPTPSGGYLGAENQLIRVMVASIDNDHNPTIVWGFDDASFLYRVQSATYDATANQTTLTLASSPVDSAHRPASGQAVELLRDAVRLTATDYIASPAGFVSLVTTAYDPTSMTIVIQGTPPSDYLSAADAPAVAAVSPSSGAASGGTVVTVTGSGFTGASAVTFGGIPGTALAVQSDAQLTVSAPAGSGTVDVIVTTPVGPSPVVAADAFVYEDASPPAIISVSPATGAAAGGTVVTVTGVGFTGASAVRFGSAPATSLTVQSDTQLTATSPPGSGLVDVSVLTAAGTSATVPTDVFSYLDTLPATVTGVSPANGPLAGGTVLTVTGTGFSGASAVHFGATNLGTSLIILSDTVLTVISPTGTGTVDVTVTTPAGTSAAGASDQFTYSPTPQPQVTAISPSNGPLSGNTLVTVTGTGFTGATAVSFGAGSPGSAVTVQSDTELTVISPAAPAPVAQKDVPVDVTVTGPGGTSPAGSDDQFTYQPPPVTGISPASGPASGATPVTVTGSGFLGGVGAVNFGTTAGIAVTVQSDTRLTVTSPGGSGTVNVTVVTPGGVSPVVAAGEFTYETTPQLYLRVWQGMTPIPQQGAAIAPGEPIALGATGVSVTLTLAPQSDSFHVGDFWRFAVRPLQPTIVYPARYLAAPQPPDGPRTWICPLAVLNWTADAVTVSNWVPAFWNLILLTAAVQAHVNLPAPAVTRVSPSSGALSGGTALTIFGSGFTGATSVTFNDVPGTSLSVKSDTQLTVSTPAAPSAVAAQQASGTTTLRVTTPVGASPANQFAQFAYLEVAGVSPATGPRAGGTGVKVTGSGFTGATAVSFGAVPGTSLVVVSDNEITATSPAGSGTVDVTVTTPLGTSPAEPSDQFAYLEVASLNPTTGPVSGGTQVTVLGSGFSGATAVMFGGRAGTALAVLNDGQLTVDTPAATGAGAVVVTVTTPLGTSPAGPAFSYEGKNALKDQTDKHKDIKEAKDGGEKLVRIEKVTALEKVSDKVVRIDKIADTPVVVRAVEAKAPETAEGVGEPSPATEGDDEPAGTGRAFIAPEERPAVGEAVLEDGDADEDKDEERS
jgi:hypothetical protein